MKDKKKVSIIVGVFLLVLITIGVTYAFFSYIGTGSTENTISSDSITFLYEEIDQQGSGIGITDALPVEDSTGKSGQAFNFRIISNTNSNISIPYEITVRQKPGTDDIGDIVKLYLTKVDNNNNEEEVKLSKYSELTTVTKNNHQEKLLHTDKVPASDSEYNQRYRLRMWIDNETSFNEVTTPAHCSDNSDKIESECTSPLEWIPETTSYPYNNKTFAVTVNVYSTGHVQTQQDIEAAASTSIDSFTVNNSAPTLNGDVYEITTQNINSSINVVPTNPYTKVNIIRTDSNYDPLAMTTSNIQRLSTAKTFELDDGDNYFKVILTSEDNSNTTALKLKIRLNLNFEITVVDTLYPVAKANGFENGKEEVLINYPSIATNKLYQIVPAGGSLNENNWETYLFGYINLNVGDTIYAKYITSTNRVSQVINYVSVLPADAIGGAAYDGDLTTSFYNEINNKYYHVSVSQDSWGQQLKLKVHTGWDRNMYFLDASGNKLNFVYNENSMNELNFKNIDDIVLSIPQNAVSFGFYHGYTHIYEIEVVPAITKQSSSKTTATSTGIISGSSTVTISYDSTATQKLYKIDNGNWQTYNNQPIVVNYNQTIYAKSVYANANESINTYLVPVDDTVLTPEAYDGNPSTYDYHGAERNGKYNYIMIDSSAWGKTLRANVDGAYSREYYFVDSSNNRVSFEYNGNTVTGAGLPNGTTDIVIPEGAVKFGHYHGLAKVYELEIIN